MKIRFVLALERVLGVVCERTGHRWCNSVYKPAALWAMRLEDRTK